MKLLPDGKCALFVKRKTEDREEPQEAVPKIGLNIRSKKRLEKLGF